MASPGSPHQPARELAQRYPDATLPCPVCAASLKAGNLTKHLDKVHAGAPTTTQWAGKDGASFIVGGMASALGVASSFGAVMVSDAAADIAMYPVLVLCLVGAGLMLGSYGDLLSATVTLERDALVLRYALGFLGRRVPLPPDRIIIGSLRGSRPAIAGGPYEEINVKHDDVRLGSYLRLAGGGKNITIGTKSGTGFRKHWDPAGYADGGKRRVWDVMLEPSALVAMEYQLVSLGRLRPRAES